MALFFFFFAKLSCSKKVPQPAFCGVELSKQGQVRVNSAPRPTNFSFLIYKTTRDEIHTLNELMMLFLLSSWGNIKKIIIITENKVTDDKVNARKENAPTSVGIT